MKIPIANAVNLLHTATHGVLATHSTQLPGYPYATVLPFVPDERHRPVLLISELAEHTKNLVADARASLVVHELSDANVLEGARMTLLGRVERFDCDGVLRAKYLRYQPDARRYLELADFAFFRFQPQRLRAIGGFGSMGWIEEEAFASAAWLTEEQETQLLRGVFGVGVELLGVDAYGADLRVQARRERLTFRGAPVAFDRLAEELAQAFVDNVADA